MGLIEYLERKNLATAKKRINKVSTDTALTLIHVVKRNVGMNADLLKPVDFARTSIYGRPHWSLGQGDQLMYSGMPTGIYFREGTDLATVAGYISRTELASDSKLQIFDNVEELLDLSENIARECIRSNGAEYL
jgi:hypothetical protein